jgi:hypothetical protein
MPTPTSSSARPSKKASTASSGCLWWRPALTSMRPTLSVRRCSPIGRRRLDRDTDRPALGLRRDAGGSSCCASPWGTSGTTMEKIASTWPPMRSVTALADVAAVVNPRFFDGTS